MDRSRPSKRDNLHYNDPVRNVRQNQSFRRHQPLDRSHGKEQKSMVNPADCEKYWQEIGVLVLDVYVTPLSPKVSGALSLDDSELERNLKGQGRGEESIVCILY